MKKTKFYIRIIMDFLKSIYFWAFNWVFTPTTEQKNILDILRINNASKAQKWFYVSVILNLVPFILASLLEAYLHNDNLNCFLNNGTLPILSFGIIATNFFYLMENIPDNLKEGKELYENMKLKVSVVGIVILFTTTIMYIFQSNFINNYKPEHYLVSFFVSLILFFYSISCAKKMFLLQNSMLEDYANAISNTKKNLDKDDDEFKN
ncbi:hypothetical protein [Arundinibacter roseus]|uniref:Uncharacterized protein n=1 Tax=Arundinibacter roseus TaxID=2070510 RepID=A0A4R4JZK2_9BACT|nr:hypothetical protein [Arundinibacter roseus]TDB60407.1 hypothetical protein EZE20_20970 [Arundinibacter roseus]